MSQMQVNRGVASSHLQVRSRSDLGYHNDPNRLLASAALLHPSATNPKKGVTNSQFWCWLLHAWQRSRFVWFAEKAAELPHQQRPEKRTSGGFSQRERLRTNGTISIAPIIYNGGKYHRPGTQTLRFRLGVITCTVAMGKPTVRRNTGDIGSTYLFFYRLFRLQ